MNLDKMRAAQQKRSPVPLATPTTTSEVTHLCGHKAPYTPAQKPEHDKQKRINQAAKLCKACTALKHQETMARQKAEAEKRREQKSAKTLKREAAISGRLPHLSRFILVWDSKDQKWRGELQVPDCPPFRAETSGVFKQLTELDRLYREWEAAEVIRNRKE